MEDISAKSLDSQEKQDPKKERAVEHLREMRDVFTPFVQKFSALFDGEDLEYGIPDLNRLEVISRDLYEQIFTYLRESHIIEPKSIAWDAPSQQAIMFECMGDSDMYDLLYEQYSNYEKKRLDTVMPGMYDESDIPSQDQMTPMFQVFYKLFLEELRQAGLKDYFLRMSREKRTVLAQNAFFVDHNSKGVKNHPMTGSADGLDSRVIIQSSKELLYGFPVGSTAHKREEFSQGEVFPFIVVLPVGEYGSEFTQRLFNTMQALYSKVGLLRDEAKRMVTAHEKMFKSTARGSSIMLNEDLEKQKKLAEHGDEDDPHVVPIERIIEQAEQNYMSAILALEEGIATLVQVLALLTANKVEGFETGEELIQALIEQEFPNKIGYLFSPAIIGPLTLAGKTIQDIVQVVDGGRLILNKDLVDFCADKKDHFQAIAERGELPAAGRGCPVAYKGKDIEVSGINVLSQIFLKVFEQAKTV